MSHLLFKAAGSGDTNAIAALLDQGADIEWRHKGTGRTALIEAAIAGHHDAVALLLARGADADAQCKAMGNTALAWAAMEDKEEIAGSLIAHGAGPNVCDPRFKRSALMLAARAGHARIVAMLLAAGADAGLTDFEGRNACAMAQDGGHAAIVQLLEGSGAPPSEPDAPPPTLPWPEADDGVPPASDPVRVTLAYILAMSAWERGGCERGHEAAGDPQFWADQLAIVARYCTPKPRARKYASYGIPPGHDASNALLAVNPASPSRADVLVLHDVLEDMPYEHCFTVLRKGGEWRIDSFKSRLLGTDEWERDIL